MTVTWSKSPLYKRVVSAAYRNTSLVHILEDLGKHAGVKVEVPAGVVSEAANIAVSYQTVGDTFDKLGAILGLEWEVTSHAPLTVTFSEV